MKRSHVRVMVDNTIKPTIKAPRNGKAFNESIYTLNEMYSITTDKYEKDYIGECLIKYYKKYSKRHKQRKPLHLDKLKGGILEPYISFTQLEGGFIAELGTAYNIYKAGKSAYGVAKDLYDVGSYAYDSYNEESKSEPKPKPEQKPDVKKITTKKQQPISEQPAKESTVKKTQINKLDDQDLNTLIRKLVDADDFKGRSKMKVGKRF